MAVSDPLGPGEPVGGSVGPALTSADVEAAVSPLPVLAAGESLDGGPLVTLGFCAAQREAGLVRLSGEIDMPDAEQLTQWLAEQVRGGVTHLDLSAVSYCGAAGVRMLMAARDAVPGGLPLRLTCSPPVLRVLTICGLDEMETLTVAAAQAKDHRSEDLS